MKVDARRGFQKDFKRLSKSDAEHVIHAIELFIDHPKHPSLNLEKVTNRSGYFSIRATIKVRILLRQTALDK